MSNEHRSYQCRIPAGSETDSILSDYAALYGKAERSLFARLEAGGNLTDLKREFLPKFGITARQFNALAAELKGKTASIRERAAGLIEESAHRIAKAKKVLDRTSDPAKRHQKMRRLGTLEARLGNLMDDHRAGRVRLCFGSRKIFRAQFDLEANGYSSLSEWRKDWEASRKSQFFVIGSKDETAGCQGCVASVQSDGSIALRLRLPYALSGNGKNIVLGGLRFGYGHEIIVAATGRNLSGNKDDWQAINYRFLRDEKGWRVFVTVALREGAKISVEDIGVIGVDINADHLAVTETDRFGNPVRYFSVPCVTYGKTTRQREAVIGDAVKQVVRFAVSSRKPLAIERLDFAKKKAVLERESPRRARMLSSFAYTRIQTFMRARAFDAGIAVHDVNPAYTSVIGRFKFGARYGLSAHSAAALVIGRRFMGLREKPPKQLQVTLPLSVRNRGRHVWSIWAAVSRGSQAAHGAHRRSGKSRSSPSPAFPSEAKARPATTPPVAGEIPAGQSSPPLFG